LYCCQVAGERERGGRERERIAVNVRPRRRKGLRKKLLARLRS
jgi:hypothetical protein